MAVYAFNPCIGRSVGWQTQGDQQIHGLSPQAKSNRGNNPNTAMASACVHMGVYTHTLTSTHHIPTCICHTPTLYPCPPQFLKLIIPTNDM